jgi:hypothetical protein
VPLGGDEGEGQLLALAHAVDGRVPLLNADQYQPPHVSRIQTQLRPTTRACSAAANDWKMQRGGLTWCEELWAEGNTSAAVLGPPVARPSAWPDRSAVGRWQGNHLAVLMRWWRALVAGWGCLWVSDEMERPLIVTDDQGR